MKPRTKKVKLESTLEPSEITSVEATKTLGKILKQAREAKKVSITQASQTLRIREAFLVALENDTFEEIPGKTYIVGFIRSYAHYLDLNAPQMTALFYKEHDADAFINRFILPKPLQENATPSKRITLYVLLALAALFCAWYALELYQATEPTKKFDPIENVSSEISHTEILPTETTPTEQLVDEKVTTLESTDLKEEKEDLGSPTPSTPSQEEQTSQPTPASLKLDTAQEQTPETSSKGITLVAQKDSWIQITAIDGTIVVDKILKTNETFQVPQQDDLYLTTGNAGGLTVILDGKKLPPLGAVGTVERNISLNKQELLQTVQDNESTD